MLVNRKACVDIGHIFDIDPIVLCFYFHPWEFIEMPEGLISYGEGSVLPDRSLVMNCGDYALEQFQKVIQLLKGIGSSFCTAKDFVRQQ